MDGIKILGMGHAIPSGRMSNEDMKQFVDTSDEWIRSRTGIESRSFCLEGESQTTLAAGAAREALANAGISQDQIGLIITATCTPDYLVPSTSCVVQQALGLPAGIPAFDINAACSGFVYGLELVSLMIGKNDPARPYALLIGAEQLSRILDFNERGTCVLFGDGAAAAVIAPDREKRFYSHLAGDGDLATLVTRTPHPTGFPEVLSQEPGALVKARRVDAGDVAEPEANDAGAGDAAEPKSSGAGAGTEPEANDAVASAADLRYAGIPETAMNSLRSDHLYMNGKNVFRFAVSVLDQEISRMEKESGVAAADVDYIVCHQANARIIEHVRRKRKLPEEMFFMNLQKYGNTSGASVPLALYDMMSQGLLTEGKRIFVVGFGAGLTWASAYLEF